MNPVVIVGGGLAALGAAYVLDRSYTPFLILEKSTRLGGRLMQSPREGWPADIGGPPYFHNSDHSLMKVLIHVGLDTEAVTLQDTVRTIRRDGTIGPKVTEADKIRLTLRGGFQRLFTAYSRRVEVIAGAAVGAIRWEQAERSFIFRDQESGRTLRHPSNAEPIRASAVILAVSAHEARAIAESSLVLEHTVPVLAGVRYRKSIVALFRTPRIDPGYYGLQGEIGGDIDWLSFEERKNVTGQNQPQESLVMVRPKGGLGDSIYSQTDGEIAKKLWSQARKAVQALPDAPTDSIVVRWSHAWVDESTRPAIATPAANTNPEGLPVTLAGDYLLGGGLEGTVTSGFMAANQLLAMIRQA